MSAGHKPDSAPRILHWRDKIPVSLAPALRARGTPSNSFMKQALTSDWGPHLYVWAHQLASIAVWFYVAGFTLGVWLHRTNNTLSALVQRLYR